MKLNVNALKKPFIAQWMSEEEVAFRYQCGKYIERALQLKIVPGTKLESVGLFSGNQGSVVYKIQTDMGIFAVKMAYTPRQVEAEASFLKIWRKNGVSTPQVIQIHSPSQTLPVSILVLEYIPHNLLATVSTSENRYKQHSAYHMGEILALMHKCTGTGYGQIRDMHTPSGIHISLESELESFYLTQCVTYLDKNNIIESANIERIISAKDTLIKHMQTLGNPSLCHNDFLPHNIFATQPLTVIDPSPTLSHPYLCLASTCIYTIANYTQHEMKQIVEGYRSLTDIESDVFQSAIIVRSLYYLYMWYKKGYVAKATELKSLVFDKTPQSFC